MFRDAARRFGNRHRVALLAAVTESSTATKLIFTTQPVGGTSGSTLATQPVVAAVNGSNVTDTAFTGDVTLAVNTTTGSHSLGGTVTIACVAGVATFTDVTDTGSGDATLTASSTGLTSATSSSFTTAASGGSFDFGINFRNTAGFRADDGATDTYSLGVVYPETRKGGTFGMDSSKAPVNDDAATYDVRLAGHLSLSNNVAKKAMRIDLPSAGTYTITLAIGAPHSGSPLGRQYVEILDNTTSLYVVDVASVGVLGVLDANGTEWTRTTWPTSQVPKAGLVFASTICWVRIGVGTGSTDFTGITHIHLLKTA